MNMGEDVLAAARALDAQRPAEAAAQLTKALGATNDPLEIEILLSLYVRHPPLADPDEGPPCAGAAREPEHRGARALILGLRHP